jgi:hypothetical protein
VEVDGEEDFSLLLEAFSVLDSPLDSLFESVEAFAPFSPLAAPLSLRA